MPLNQLAQYYKDLYERWERQGLELARKNFNLERENRSLRAAIDNWKEEGKNAPASSA